MLVPDAACETFKQRRDNNILSWQWMIAFYEAVMTYPLHRERCSPLLRLVRQIADSPDATEFRAGYSGHDLWISTKPENGLRTNDPHIRVAAGYGSRLLDVEFWRGIQADGLVESHTVSEGQLLNTIKPLLARLRSAAQVCQN